MKTPTMLCVVVLSLRSPSVNCTSNAAPFYSYPFLSPKQQQQQAKKSGGSKKPLSGFMLFSKENRPKVKEDNPDITFGQIGKKLGEMWRALTDEEKQAFKDRKG